MASRKITDAGEDLADAVSTAGRKAGARARRAGSSAGATIERGASKGATRVRRAARSSADAYDAATDEVDGRVDSIEETIRRNPIAAAGAALLVGVVLGRFIL